MALERRRAARVPCRLPAAGPRGSLVIEDLSPFGAQVRAASPARVGDALPLDLTSVDGRHSRLRGAVRRVKPSGGGFLIGCSFEPDPSSCVDAWRLLGRLKRGTGRFVQPATERPSKIPSAPRRAPRFEIGLRAFVLIGAGIVVLLLGGLLAILAAMVG